MTRRGPDITTSSPIFLPLRNLAGLGLLDPDDLVTVQQAKGIESQFELLGVC